MNVVGLMDVGPMRIRRGSIKPLQVFVCIAGCGGVVGPKMGAAFYLSITFFFSACSAGSLTHAFVLHVSVTILAQGFISKYIRIFKKKYRSVAGWFQDNEEEQMNA